MHHILVMTHKLVERKNLNNSMHTHKMFWWTKVTIKQECNLESRCKLGQSWPLIKKHYLRWLWATMVVIIFINGAPVIPRAPGGAPATPIRFRALISPLIVVVPCRASRASTFTSWTITEVRSISLGHQPIFITGRYVTFLLWAATLRWCTMLPYLGGPRTPWPIFRNWASCSSHRGSRSTGKRNRGPILSLQPYYKWSTTDKWSTIASEHKP